MDPEQKAFLQGYADLIKQDPGAAMELIQRCIPNHGLGRHPQSESISELNSKFSLLDIWGVVKSPYNQLILANTIPKRITMVFREDRVELYVPQHWPN